MLGAVYAGLDRLPGERVGDVHHWCTHPRTGREGEALLSRDARRDESDPTGEARLHSIMVRRAWPRRRTDMKTRSAAWLRVALVSWFLDDEEPLAGDLVEECVPLANLVLASADVRRTHTNGDTWLGSIAPLPSSWGRSPRWACSSCCAFRSSSLEACSPACFRCLDRPPAVADLRGLAVVSGCLGHREGDEPPAREVSPVGDSAVRWQCGGRCAAGAIGAQFVRTRLLPSHRAPGCGRDRVRGRAPRRGRGLRVGRILSAECRQSLSKPGFRTVACTCSSELTSPVSGPRRPSTACFRRQSSQTGRSPPAMLAAGRGYNQS